jgi:inulin fructotransferase (DFA-I-forming)
MQNIGFIQQSYSYGLNIFIDFHLISKEVFMVPENYYDVTRWPVGNPYQDIGEVINSIIADIKSRQTETDINDGGKPGAAIYIPPGDYHLKTQVLIDISYLKIMGSGHGFVSSSIRFNTPADEWANLHDIWPGGSRILVDLCPQPGDEEHAGAAFYVKRSGAPRISSVAFENFCIDGLHFVDDGLGNNDPENSYTNGKTGIYIASAQDAFRITGMGFIYLEHGLTAYNSDAMAIHNNFIAECGNCIELRGAGQASKITDNLIGAGYKGYSIYAQNFGGY